MLSDRICELRMARGMTQVNLAKVLGVSKQCVSNWENDNIQPSIEMLIHLADFFSVSTDFLLGRDDRRYLDASGLSTRQLTHIQLLIEDLQKQ